MAKHGKKAAFGLLALALMLSGCSESGHGLRWEAARTQKSGVVSLSSLVRQNPDWLLVARTDQAIGRYQSLLATPALLGVQPGAGGITAIGLLPAVPGKALPAMAGSQSSQELHLNRLSERQIARLEASLEIAENERLAAQKKLAQAQADQEFLSGRAQITDRFLAVERAIIAGDSGHRVNLVIQIEALRVNAARPRTAPDDYWSKIAAQKEEELAGINSGTAKQLSLAAEASNAEVAALGTRLNTQAATQVAQMEAQIDRENTTVVQGLRDRLRKQRSQILAMTRALQSQVDASIASLGSAKGAPKTDLAANWPAAVAAADRSVAGSLPAWRVRLASTITTLQKQRDRQAALVTEETRRAVLQVAQNDRLRITGWQGEGADLTQIVLQSLRKERWGKA